MEEAGVTSLDALGGVSVLGEKCCRRCRRVRCWYSWPSSLPYAGVTGGDETRGGEADGEACSSAVWYEEARVSMER